ncbi:MAG: SAM-dependent chlorinase/fluorinase [Deltaproteobacteria bacterium]|nr:SAM-dependent chlorinase/fluorinase [Deltaproteobacteria bacterium]
MTFLSDFSLRDAYVAQVKGRILTAVPEVNIVDITHEVSSYTIISAAWLLYTTYCWFPRGSIHLAVVDPGVGTQRALIVLEKEDHIFIGPDNGIFSFLYGEATVREVIWKPADHVCNTFHARDIFAPLVVEILNGVEPSSLGRLKVDPVSFDIRSHMVVHIDNFGNIVTNIEGSLLKTGYALQVAGHSIGRIVQTFDDLRPGELGLVCGSVSTIEIVARQKSAADMLGVTVGMPTELLFS